MDKTEIERLERAITRDRKGSTRPGVAFNPRLRAQLVPHARTRPQSGDRLGVIAISVGIKYDTLRYWIEGPGAKGVSRTAQFRRARVVKAELGAEQGVTLLGGDDLAKWQRLHRRIVGPNRLISLAFLQ